MWLQKSALAILLISLAVTSNAQAPTTQYPPFPPGMRLISGAQGVLLRNDPSLSSLCGMPPHECLIGDATLPGVYGIVQSNPPVFDASGWWWVYMIMEDKKQGWASGYPPYLNPLTPPQMAQGFSFRVVGDYNGPTLTGSRCISDGVQSDAVMSLQASGTGQMGTLSCLWTTPAVGNHIAVINATNANGTTPSTEFQFAVTAQAIPQIPSSPQNLRIGPTSSTGTAATAFKPGLPPEAPTAPTKKE